MARVHYVKKAQQRYATVPVLNEDGTPKVTPVLRKNGTPKRTKSGREVTMRVTVADKSSPLPNRNCGKCGKEIEVGQPYKWVAVKSGPYGGRKLYRCGDCPVWKQSELSSSKMAGIYAAQEQLDEALGNVSTSDDITELAQQFAESVREVAMEYQEAASNIEDGFGHPTSMSEDLQQRADDLESWADEIESIDVPEQPDEDEFTFNADGEPFEGEGDRDEEVYCYNENGETYDEAFENWQDEAVDSLTDLTGSCPI